MSLRKGMLVGVRFSIPLNKEWSDVSRPVGGFAQVVDLPPVSGPIYLHWSPGGLSRSSHEHNPPLFWARCDRCGETSRRYKRNGSHIKTWANDHRCDQIFDEVNGA